MADSALTVKETKKYPKWITFDRLGKSSFDLSDTKTIANRVDRHNALWNRLPINDDKKAGVEKGIGPGLLIALFETVTALFLGVLEKSPATFTNLATTLSELAQVFISGFNRKLTNILDNIKDEVKKKKMEKELEQRAALSNRCMAGVVALAGGIGLLKESKEIFSMFKGEDLDIHSLPISQKLLLTASSLTSSVAMFAGYSEKCSLAPVSIQNGGYSGREMDSNGHSDKRCSFEWFAMPVYLWFKKFKFVKTAIDFILPLSAFLDGAGRLYESFSSKETHHEKCNHDHSHNHGHDHHECNHGFSGLIKKLVTKILGLKENGHKEFLVPKMFFNDFFFGDAEGKGFRAKILVPVYKLFGCDPPVCFLENNKLMVKLPSQAPDISYQLQTQRKRESKHKHTSENTDGKRQVANMQF